MRAYVSNRPDVPQPEDLDPVLAVTDLTDELIGLPAVIAVATPPNRMAAVREAKDAGFAQFPALVDPTSVLARSVIVEDGAMVNAAVVIAPRARLAGFATVNRGCSLGHDAVVEDFAFLGPSVVLSGGVSVGSGAFVGAGSVVLPGVIIGKGAVVGAGAVVVRDVAEDARVVGNPARPLEH